MNRTIVIVAFALLALATAVYSIWLTGTRESPEPPAVSPSQVPAFVEMAEVDDGSTDDPFLDESILDDALDDDNQAIDRVPGATRRHPLMDRTLAELWDELAPRAMDGDADAAFRLYRALDTCIRMASRDLDDPRWQQRLANMPPENAERLRNWTRMVQDRCADGTPEQYATTLDWLTQAADFGHTGAQLMWAMSAHNHLDMSDETTSAWYRQASDRYLEQARDAGQLTAMMMIGMRKQSDDPVNAWAHMSLASRMLDERSRAATLEGRTTRHAGFNARLQVMLSNAGRELDERQLAAAQQQADELYERCCRR